MRKYIFMCLPEIVLAKRNYCYKNMVPLLLWSVNNVKNFDVLYIVDLEYK